MPTLLLSITSILTDSTLLQLPPELLDFLLILPQQGILRIFIDSGIVLDVLGPVGIPQGADGLVEVIVRWADVGNLRRCRTAFKSWCIDLLIKH